MSTPYRNYANVIFLRPPDRAVRLAHMNKLRFGVATSVVVPIHTIHVAHNPQHLKILFQRNEKIEARTTSGTLCAAPDFATPTQSYADG